MYSSIIDHVYIALKIYVSDQVIAAYQEVNVEIYFFLTLTLSSDQARPKLHIKHISIFEISFLRENWMMTAFESQTELSVLL